MPSSRSVLWIAIRLVLLTTAGVLAVVFLSSWWLAILVGGLTITAVAADGWMRSRGQADQVALDPSAPTPERLTVDLRRRP